MNILILVGLFALGIVAIVGVVLLGRGEQRQNKARANGTRVQAPSLVEPQPYLSPRQGTLSGGEVSSIPPETVVSGSQRLTVPLDRVPAMVQRDEQPYLSPRQGSSVRPMPVPQTGSQQFQEVADEIRELHQHAWELEQRLGTLTDMVDHLERVQTGHTIVEEEQPAQ